MFIIYNFQIFVNAVKKNVDEVEDKVIVAEREIGTNSIKKVLSSISVPGFRQVVILPFSIFVNYRICSCISRYHV